MRNEAMFDFTRLTGSSTVILSDLRLYRRSWLRLGSDRALISFLTCQLNKCVDDSLIRFPQFEKKLLK